VTATIERTASGAMSWFFGANASIDGGMISIEPSSSPSHAYASREKT
jgi:hypothetical protein